MPVGAAQFFPSGLWVLKPKPTTIPILVATTCIKLAIPLAFFGGLGYLRSLTYNYTYTTYIGKSISMGHMSNLTHEPLSVKEIDKLKEAQAERRRKAKTTDASSK